MLLIDSGGGVVTPYGVVYDNGMKLEQVYNGRQFPACIHTHCAMMLGIRPQYGAKEGENPECLYLPASEKQIERAMLRAGMDTLVDAATWVEFDELPERVEEALDLDQLSGDDIPALNRMCRAITPMKDADMEKLDAVVLMTDASDIIVVCQLAENLVILTNNVAQVNNHLAVTEHAYSTVFLVMSPTTWANLGEEYQAIFTEVMEECSISERELSRQMDAEAIGKLEEQGMVATYPDKQEFVDKAANLYSQWEETYGDVITQIRSLGTAE